MNVFLTGWLDDDHRVPIYQVTDTIIAKEGAAIDADLNEEGFGAIESTVIHTAGFASMKQKGLDGSWAAVE